MRGCETKLFGYRCGDRKGCLGLLNEGAKNGYLDEAYECVESASLTGLQTMAVEYSPEGLIGRKCIISEQIHQIILDAIKSRG